MRDILKKVWTVVAILVGLVVALAIVFFVGRYVVQEVADAFRTTTRPVFKTHEPRVFSNSKIKELSEEAERRVGPATSGFAITDTVDKPPRPGCVSIKSVAGPGGIFQQWMCPKVVN